MDFITAVIGLLLLLHNVEGQTTADPVPMITTASSTTSPSTESLTSTTPHHSSVMNPASTTAASTLSNSSVMNTTSPTVASTLSNSSVMNTTSPTVASTLSNSSVINTTSSTVASTLSNSSAINTTSTTVSSTFPTFTTPSYSRKCSAYPPLCCAGLNNSCYRGCYCDVACLRFRDCCPDFSTTCVTGSSSTSTTPNPDGQNGTSINTTASPVSNVTSTPPFPLNTYSGKCSEEPKLCCVGSNINCFRGCFCDEACVQYNDCCPDYMGICKNDIETVIGELRVSLLTTAGTSDQTIEASLYNATVRLQAYLKNISSAIESVRIIKFIKT
ncbi:putative GPI-anchored protein pfl2 [Megalops cyprinoides]|uniref:putative GPI-anchored protein pfl2 n=1 Tax=Megalops cyprinoides TaxID=118141 RepID=UPI0018653B23|nr:putative GPI-anchored protein pfl2 [Megalops cyprinoides]